MRATIVARPVERTHLAKQRYPRGKERLLLWRGWGELLIALFGLIWFLVAFAPILYMLSASLRDQTAFLTDSPWLPPPHPTLGNYEYVLANDFGTYFANSVFVTVVSVVVIVTITLFASYAISRIRNGFTRFVLNLFLVGLAIPLQATIIPLYALIVNLHLYDTLFALILPSVAFGIPLSVLVLVTYIRDIPMELHESMILDGASHFQILRSLVLPLSRPALITVIIYQSIGVWNGFLFPLVMTQSPNVRVLPLALWSYQGQFTQNAPAILASVLLSATPIILLYIFGRRYLLGGLIAGFSK
jgi:raffinose/stachyose/melibiose transport system permease protein